jgi:RNA polymerase sigma factor (sigma-70 family)
LDTTFQFDAEYLARVRAKDQATLKHFCEYFSTPIRNKVGHSLPRQNVDDMVQDIFAAVLERIDAGEPREPEKLPGYIFGICRNLILQEWDRKKNPPVPESDLASIADRRESIEALLVRSAPIQSVQFILKKLPDRYREAIERVYILEQDRQTAARAMGTTTDNLRLILLRALRKFRELWTKYFGDSPLGRLPSTAA